VGSNLRFDARLAWPVRLAPRGCGQAGALGNCTALGASVPKELNGMTVTERALADCPTGQAMRIIECCDRTLVNMGKRVEIKFRKTATGRYRWNVAEYLERKGQTAE
jgi:hypothetical protein